MPHSNTTITGLTPGLEYHFRVRARGLHGNGHYSDSIVVKTGLDDQTSEQIKQGDVALVAGVIAGAVSLIIVILAAVFIRRKKGEQKAEELRIQRKLADETASFLTTDGLGSSATGSVTSKFVARINSRSGHASSRKVFLGFSVAAGDQ